MKNGSQFEKRRRKREKSWKKGNEQMRRKRREWKKKEKDERDKEHQIGKEENKKIEWVEGKRKDGEIERIKRWIKRKKRKR